MRSSNKLSFFLLIILLFIQLVSCNVEKNRKLLTLFFDGIPESEQFKTGQSDRRLENKKIIKKNVLPIISIHPDYKTKNCSKCHIRSVSSFLVAEGKKICFICHKKEKFTGKYVHGPVAVGACKVCHEPHKSVNRKLLLEDGEKLCILCHRIPLSDKSLTCSEENCLNCHEPHVSANKYFLKNRINSEKKKYDRSDNFHNTTSSENENN